MVRTFPDQDIPGEWFEERHQADFTLFAANGVPGEPNAIGRPQLGWAEVPGQFVGGEHKLPVRLVPAPLGGRVVEGVDDQFALNGHRLVLLVIEVDPAAEPAGGGLSRLVTDRVRPDHRHLAGHSNGRIV
jgi:hypothetical protein